MPIQLKEPWGIHWFRRDLRIAGNEALRENWKRTAGNTLSLFCFDAKFLARADFSHNRFAFFLETLKALKADLREQGGDLLVVDCLAFDAFPKILEYCRTKKISPPSLVTWNRDYEPFARVRDQRMEKVLRSEGIETWTARDHLLFEPHEILKSEKSDDFYQIYSPYAKKWFERLAGSEGQSRLKAQGKAGDYFQRVKRDPNLFKISWSVLRDLPLSDSLNSFCEQNQPHVTVPIPEAGFFAAYRELLNFKEKIKSYKNDRDIPSVKGTSRLSIYLKNGSLTTAQIISALELGRTRWFDDSGPCQFVKELAWREFYYSILYHRPDVETQAFLPQYKDIKWQNSKDWFRKWQDGMTGFPIVDAGMRQLKTTGWMHNRVRMIVASFLTKDLLIDWRWGENHFMKELLDGDLAPNNGGWQWAASTGCDPQPYFRIFNPWLQSKKFDGEGDYIRKYVPELKAASAKDLHDAEADRTRFGGYPAPIVDHSHQRNLAINLYKKV